MDSSSIAPSSAQIGETTLHPENKECGTEELSGLASTGKIGGTGLDSQRNKASITDELCGSVSTVQISETSLSSPKKECPDEVLLSGSASTVEKKECGAKGSPGSSLALKSGKKKQCSGEESSGSASSVKSGKNSVKKISSQIRKPPHRRSASPINWFPRKKTDSFMKRKIRLLQEVGGMNSSLDETLGDSYPHYSRVEREKIAARAAARKAMEARKAALVEASWCRILRAARIPSKEAESQLMKAEEIVTEAFQEAAAMGVIMYDRPDCPRQKCEIETSSTSIGGGSTHTVTASFETAFEVDKEVAAAVRTAFIRLANCPTSSNKDEFQDLLRKISQNPEMSGTDQELSECESDHGSELEPEPCSDDFGTRDVDFKIPDMEARPRTYRNKKLPPNGSMKGSNSAIKLVDKMLDRLKRLQDDELASLATIVATCGLSAALREEESFKHLAPDSIASCSAGPPVTLAREGSRRESNISNYMDGHMKRKQAVMEVPSLDKFLVKHVSKLEREVQEARNTRKTSATVESEKTMVGSDGHVLERGVVDPKNGAGNMPKVVPGLGSILVKHTSRLEKEIEEAKKSKRAFGKGSESFQDAKDRLGWDADQVGKENLHSNNSMSASFDEKSTDVPDEMSSGKDPSSFKYMSRIERAKLEALQAFSAQGSENSGLDKMLVKSIHRLEREKMQALRKDNAIQRDEKKPGTVVTSESLDNILVKHVSRLEKEKMAHWADVEMGTVKKTDQKLEGSGESLAKESVVAQQSVPHAKHSETRREARERELQEAWGGLSLGNCIKPHLSRLERDKAAWRRAEEEERRCAREARNC